MVSVNYIYHDCFLVETDFAYMVFDFWKVPESTPDFPYSLDKGKPLYVFVSHFHKDHFNPEIYGWEEYLPMTHYIISRDVYRASRHFFDEDSIFKGHKVDPGKVTVLAPGESFDDGVISVMAFGSTDEGDSFYIDCDGKSFFHAGDLNAWIWKDESAPEEVEAALEDFNSILSGIAEKAPEIDFCFWPVDARLGSGYFTGAGLMLSKINVGHFFPMHFELGETAKESEEFHKAAADFHIYANKSRGEYIALLSPGDRFVSFG